MRRLNSFLGLIAILAACSSESDIGTSRSEPELPELSAQGIADHMRILASDDFFGRGPGHLGGDLASAYIAEQFSEYGLEAPGGSYFQTVPMVGMTTDPTTVKLSFTGSEGAVTPTYLDEFVLNAGDPLAGRVGGDAELVFAGYGAIAPENEWNDFQGIDVQGKYLMILVNDPPASPSEPDLFGGVAMTYYGRWTYKYEEAARQGALGAIIVHETEPAGYPWSVVRGGWSGEQFALPLNPTDTRPAGMVGWVSESVAQRALATAGYDYEELKRRAAIRGFTAVETGITVSASVESTSRDVETRNVVAVRRGSTRPDEYLTVTSHYDHFGVGESIAGDSIYNGAYDNASGTALLLEVAHAISGSQTPLGRSVLFIATAAEEQGLLGAERYVRSPIYPLSQTVAEINLDGANLWGLTDDIIVHGEERSELGNYVRPRATQLGLTLRPDAEPEKGFFFRSDHFPFAKAGVPSLWIEHGRNYRGQPAGWGAQLQADYTANRYHAPSDEFSDEFTFDGAVQQGTLLLAILFDAAADVSWPNWHVGQEFKGARDAMLENR